MSAKESRTSFLQLLRLRGSKVLQICENLQKFTSYKFMQFFATLAPSRFSCYGFFSFALPISCERKRHTEDITLHRIWLLILTLLILLGGCTAQHKTKEQLLSEGIKLVQEHNP